MSLDDLLASRFLVVPDYQRGYAWAKEQLDEYWEDLDLLQPGKRHYTGTLVLQRMGQDRFDDERQLTLEAHHVVDGQQRLTTCFMLLDRIYDRLESMGHPATPTERQRLLTANFGGVLQPKLQLAPDLLEHWAKVILNGAQPVQGPRMAAERRLSEAAAYFEERLGAAIAGMAPTGSKQFLLQLAGKVVNGLQFSLYEVEDGSEVGTIFETVNQRGKDLSELEKVKNYLLFLASLLPTAEQRSELSAQVNLSWKDIFGNLATMHERSEDQLLRAHWLATENPRPKEWDEAKSIKRRFHRVRYVHDTDLLRAEVTAYAQSLRRASRAYRDLLEDRDDAFDAFADEAGQLRSAARRIRQAGVVLAFAPLLLAGRLTESVHANAYLRLLEACEIYSVRVFLITGARANAGQVRLYTLAHELHRTGDFGAATGGVYERVSYFASDEATRADLLNTRRNWYRKPGHKFFLYQYEISLLRGVAPQVTFEELVTPANRIKTTEHILPQTPVDDCWNTFTAEDRERYTNSLGNLVLTFDNSVYSNFCFSRKRDGIGAADGSRTACFATSTLKQEQALATVPDWTPETLETRQALIADWAMQRWPLPLTRVTFTASDEDDAATEEMDPLLEDEPGFAGDGDAYAITPMVSVSS